MGGVGIHGSFLFSGGKVDMKQSCKSVLIMLLASFNTELIGVTLELVDNGGW